MAMEEQIGDSKRGEKAFRRAKIVQVAMEELTSGNGRAENVAMEEQESATGRA